MTKKLVMQAVVPTNDVKGSVCRIDVKAVTFAELWEGYVSGKPYRDTKTGEVPPGYDNQCAIRMSATLHKVGVEMKSFTPAHVTVKAGNVFGRILLNGKFAATRADQLGSWLNKQPFCGLPPKPENITGKNWESKIKGRTGIIMFDGYWTRDGEAAADASGGHIDLWNGSRLTISGVAEGFATIGRYLGIRSFRQGAGVAEQLSYSDLGNSRSILFWNVK